MVRDAVVLAMPFSPLQALTVWASARAAAATATSASAPATGPPADPRWAGLGRLIE